jgi:hypothetical protein
MPAAPTNHEVALLGTDQDRQLLVDGAVTHRLTQPEEILGGLAQTLLELTTPGVDWLAIIHAGGLALGGRGLIFAAPSGSGKSTLTAYLARRPGFDYLGDDLVAIDASSGRILPWPTHPSLKSGSWALFAESDPGLATQPQFADSGRRWRYLDPPVSAWPDPVVPNAILCPSYRLDARAELVALSPLEALQALVADRVWLGGVLDAPRADRFLTWLEQMPAYRLTYSSLDHAESLVRDTFQRVTHP